MTENQYVLGFILMAIAIALVLGLGTLMMAGMLHRHHRAAAEHHHWYDRFHFHHA